MAAAFGWGLLAASSLVIGALIALRFRISLRVIGLIMGFGAGVLISAVAFDLIDEAADVSSGQGAIIGGLFAGCAVFFGGDWLIDRLGGSAAEGRGRKPGGRLRARDRARDRARRDPGVDGDRPDDLQGRGRGCRVSGRSLHLQPARGDLLDRGPRQQRLAEVPDPLDVDRDRGDLRLSPRSPATRVFQNSSPDVVAFVLAFAAGAILTMLADTMMPEAFEHGGKLAGVVTTLGFAVAFTIHSLE